MALNPGDTLNNNHYRIIRQLGRGGFGFVYLSRDTLLGEQVAIKELIPALVGDEATLKRFLAEARATMRLTHKHIVRTHNVFAEGGNYYIVMEYMAGGSLEERLRAGGPLPLDEALLVAAEVCEGLACAHEEQVVHCDLKPANILFDAKGRAKVADFGIAHVSGEMLTRSWMTPAGFVAGTLPYMSPEQAAGVRDDPRIDIYAAGAVLYRMLTGRTYLDFDERETPVAQAENVLRIRSQEPRAPGIHNPQVPRWLDRLVLTSLAKRTEERYQAVEAMRAALLAGGGAEPALAPGGPAIRPAHRARRRPARAIRPAWFWPAAGAGVLFPTILIALAVLLGGPAGQQASPTPELTRLAAVGANTATAPAVHTLPAAVTTTAPFPTMTATDEPLPSATNTARPPDTSTPSPSPTPSPATTETPTATATVPTPRPTDTASPTRTPVQPTPTATPRSRPLQGKIAYCTQSREERASIYVLDLDTGQVIRLGFGGAAAISHDGTRVVYYSFEGQFAAVVLVDLVTGQRWQVKETSAPGGMCGGRAGEISWDGNRIALDGVYVWERDNQRFLTQGGDAIWSPDDGWLAYYDHGRLYKMPVSGGNAVDLAESTWSSWGAWSSRNEIAFVRNDDIYVMNAGGSAQRRLTDHPGQDRYPAWSSDGRRILFYSDRAPRGWYIMNADGTSQTHLPEFDGYSMVSWTG